MRITALVIILCAGAFAWYSYSSVPRVLEANPAEDKPPAVAEPVVREAQPERLAVHEAPCPAIERARDWDDLKAVYPGVGNAELCEFIVAPDFAKLTGMAVDPVAAEALLNRLFAEGDEHGDQFVDVPDLRYYLDPQAVELMRGLSESELIERINNGRSAEAAYWLAQNYREDEQSYVLLMLSAASYAQKPGPLLDAINGCCRYSPDDPASKRAADIKREALVMVARELHLPEAADWLDYELDADIEAEVLAQRAAYVAELNQYSRQAFGEDWIK
jgi:hypothetical protein